MGTVFRLARVVGGILHFAEVELHVQVADRDEVSVSEEVFAWRRQSYGPHAAIGGPEDRRMMAEAAAGVRYTLDQLVDRDQYAVIVRRVVDSTVDTGIGDVKYAAAHATCQALGIEPAHQPRLDVTGPVFPD
jgi:hypothetical protein